MNTLLEQYRQARPDDQRPDDEITATLGAWNDLDGRYNSYPDFVEDYQRIKATQAQAQESYPQPAPSILGEAAKGAAAGTRSLESTAVGAGALAAGVVGADQTKQSLVKKYRDIEEESGKENAPAVPRIQDIHSVHDALLYLGYQGGQFLPNVAEAGVMGVVGAAAGSAVGPEGTAAGGAGGAMEGFFFRQAAKSALKYLVDNAEDAGVKAAIKAGAKE